MPTAKKTVSGNYSVVVSRNYERKRFTAPTKREAELLALEWTQRQKVCTISFAYSKLMQTNMSPTTRKAYESIYRTHIEKYEKVPLNELPQLDIKNLSPKTQKNIYGFIGSMAKSVGVPYTPPQIKQRKKEIQIPTKEQVELLIKNSHDDLQTAIMLGAYLGLRRSEICALTQEDFDQVKKTLRINKAYVITSDNTYTTKSTKTEKSTRILTVPPTLCKHLSNISKPKFVEISPNNITDKFMHLTHRLGIKMRFHDLRHYNISVLLSLNVPINYIMERTGHSTPNMINNVYGHIIKDKQIEIAEQIDNFFK